MYNAFAASGTLNSHRPASSLVRLVVGEERWGTSDHHQSVLPLNYNETEKNRIVTCMVLKATHNDRHCIQPVGQAGDKGLMIWRACGWNEIGPLINIKGYRTGNEYLSHLENVVKPLMQDRFPDDDGIYQDDNGTPHLAQTVQTWFNYNHGVLHLKWSSSPDISVIEICGMNWKCI
ncbi:hypothetical protein TNCV_4281241 [Trichonephila clavipes]|nr:hypothetical protein TNCV_4281241 [Trichonephila clavipes]